MSIKNKLLFSFYSLFTVGFILKFFHIHYNAIFMLTGLGGVLLINTMFLANKESRVYGFLHLSVFSWLLLLFITIKFYPFQIAVLVFAIIVSVFAVVNLFNQQKTIWVSPLVFCAVIAITCHTMPADYRYYILNVKWNYEIDRDFITLDKYSWFLYQNGHSVKALQVSDKALQIAEQTGSTEWLDFIMKHNKSIRSENWNSYR